MPTGARSICEHDLKVRLFFLGPTPRNNGQQAPGAQQRRGRPTPPRRRRKLQLSTHRRRAAGRLPCGLEVRSLFWGLSYHLPGFTQGSVFVVSGISANSGRQTHSGAVTALDTAATTASCPTHEQHGERSAGAHALRVSQVSKVCIGGRMPCLFCCVQNRKNTHRAHTARRRVMSGLFLASAGQLGAAAPRRCRMDSADSNAQPADGANEMSGADARR